MSEILSGTPSGLPSVRIAITDVCNMRCMYCPTDGDSVEMQAGRLNNGELEHMVGAALEAGFTDFSITGGEPLLNDRTAAQVFDLARFIGESRTDRGKTGYLKLNTNGANLLRYRDGLVGSGFDELKVSLDTLDPITFKALNRRSGTVLAATIDGILALRQHIPIRLQTVVGKYNAEELPDIISFCRVSGIDIKLFDMSRYDNALAGSGQFCDDNYVPLDRVSEGLQQEYGDPSIKYAVGGYGHPKKVFTTPEGTKIEVRDTAVSAHYSSELCESCPKYMCQDGLCNIVIAADGHIRFCREGGVDQTLSTRDETGGLMSAESVRQQFARAAGMFAAARIVGRQTQFMRQLLPLVEVNDASSRPRID